MTSSSHHSRAAAAPAGPSRCHGQHQHSREQYGGHHLHLQRIIDLCPLPHLWTMSVASEEQDSARNPSAMNTHVFASPQGAGGHTQKLHHRGVRETAAVIRLRTFHLGQGMPSCPTTPLDGQLRIRELSCLCIFTCAT